MNLAFRSPEYLLFAVPLFLILLLLRWRTHAFVGHSLVHRFKSLTIHTSFWVGLPRILTVVSLLLVGLTLLEPVLSLSRVRTVTRGLNIVLVVDLSSSMFEYMTTDTVPGLNDEFPPTKLEATRAAIRDFVRNRRGDRVGTVIFSERAYVVNPLTLDYQYVADYLDDVDYRTLAGEGRTAIGEGIFTSLGLLRWKDPERESQAVIVVLTDGENNAGRTIYEGLAQAGKEKVRVYLIGLQVWYLSNRDQLEAALGATGGRFFDVQRKEELQEAYDTIDSLERQQLITEQYVRDTPYYQPFVCVALFFFVGACLLRAFPRFTEIC